MSLDLFIDNSQSDKNTIHDFVNLRNNKTSAIIKKR